MSGLRQVTDDQRLAVLQVLAGRRRSLGEDHTRVVSQLHHLLPGFIPGGAHASLSAAQAKAMDEDPVHTIQAGNDPLLTLREPDECIWLGLPGDGVPGLIDGEF